MDVEEKPKKDFGDGGDGGRGRARAKLFLSLLQRLGNCKLVESLLVES